MRVGRRCCREPHCTPASEAGPDMTLGHPELPLGFPLPPSTVTLREAPQNPCWCGARLSVAPPVPAGSSDFTEHVHDPQSHSRREEVLLQCGRCGARQGHPRPPWVLAWGADWADSQMWTTGYPCEGLTKERGRQAEITWSTKATLTTRALQPNMSLQFCVCLPSS